MGLLDPLHVKMQNRFIADAIAPYHWTRATYHEPINSAVGTLAVADKSAPVDGPVRLLCASRKNLVFFLDDRAIQFKLKAFRPEVEELRYSKITSYKTGGGLAPSEITVQYSGGELALKVGVRYFQDALAFLREKID